MLNVISHWSFYWLIAVVLLSFYSFFRSNFFSTLLPILSVITISSDIVGGLSISPIKVFILISVCYIALARIPNFFYSVPYLKQTFIFLFLVALWSIYAAFNVPESQLYNVARSSLQLPPFRGLLATGFFLASSLTLLLPFYGNNKTKAAIVMIRNIATIVLFILALSIIQFVLHKVSPSLDYIWNFITMKDGGLSEINSYIGYRVSLFSQEPKYYGVLVGNMVALNLLLRMYPVHNNLSWIKSNFLLAISIFFIFATASITAIISTILGLIGIFLHNIFFVKFNRVPIYKLFTVIFIFLAILMIVLYNAEYTQERFMNYSMMGSLSGSGIYNDYGASLSTTAYIMWILQESYRFIVGVGIGNGAFYAYEYISVSSGFFDKGFTSSRVPLLDIFSGIGIIGVVFMYWIWFKWVKLLSRQFYSKNDPTIFIVGYIVYQIIVGLMVNNLPFVWFLFGMAFSIVISNRRQYFNNAR